ncbi:beta-ketoacyl-[acyl-carrier-protein] synthase family protein [Amycolatopsis sp. NPDC004378]
MVTAHRVVLTGLGALSSIGQGAEEFAAGLRAGRSGARDITGFDTTGFDHSRGCEVRGFEPRDWIRNLPVESLGRASRFAVAAARMAIDDAGVAHDWLRSRRGMVAIGTTDGESNVLDELAAAGIDGGREALAPSEVRRVPPTRLSTAIARELGLGDVEATTIATACSAGNYALGYGFDAVKAGEVDFALCGGADAVCRKTFAGFYRLGTIAPDNCRPFDIGRKGILTGEGAGVLLLETLESALARGARIHAEVLGYGLNCDAYHQVAPNQDGVANCMRLALADAGLDPAQVDLVSAHGTGTKANDVTECGAIHDVFGADVPRTVSLKSMLGHTMGAASALAAIAGALAIREGFVFPTINHVETDPECAVDCVPNHAVEAEIDVVQNNGMAFGGNNASVVLGRYPALAGSGRAA